MSYNSFLGTAEKVVQVDTFTPVNVEIGDIFTLTITGWDGTSEAISFTATDATVLNVTAGLETAWNASTHALCTPITAADNTTDLTLTADTAGVAFKVAGSAVNGGATDDQELNRVATTKNEGPSDFSSIDNWSAGEVPGDSAGADVYIANTSIDILYGLDRSGMSNALDSMHILQTYTGKIGHNGATGLVGAYLQIKVTALYLGEHFYTGLPAGSGRIKIDLGSTTQSAVIVYNTGSAIDSNKPAVRLLANNASTVIREIRKGSVGIAFLPGETTTIDSCLLSYENNVKIDASLTIGPGCTIATYNQTGGNGTILCAVTTIGADDGELLIAGEGAIANLNVDGTNVDAVTTGTITNTNITSGEVDTTRSADPRQFTNVNLDPTGSFKFDPSVITLPNGIVPVSSSGRIAYRASKG